MVRQEAERLEALRAAAATASMAYNVSVGDRVELSRLAPPIAANYGVDALALLDRQGVELFGWQRAPQGEGEVKRPPADFSPVGAVWQVLNGAADAQGDKHLFLGESDEGPLIYTAGPLYLGEDLVGAVLVGTYAHQAALDLSAIAAADVTLYHTDGTVVATTLPAAAEPGLPELVERPERYEQVTAPAGVAPLRQKEVGGRSYTLAYGDWRLRDQSVGFFSVALPDGFLVESAAAGRRQVALVFSLGAIAAIFAGFALARAIARPLERLAATAEALAAGDLRRRSGVRGGDEVGRLGAALDTLAERLAGGERRPEPAPTLPGRPIITGSATAGRMDHGD
jgi:HAMP domain-containing protein